MNRTNLKNAGIVVTSSTLLVLLIISFVIANVITISGNCTGTTNISNTNYTFTGSCTGTISTSNNTQNELIAHAFNPNCQPIDIPQSVTYFNQNFSSTNKTWSIATQIHDKPHNQTVIVEFTANHGNHTFVTKFISPTINETEITPVTVNDGATTFGQQRPLNSPIIAGDNIDVYADMDSPQIIWYINNTMGIENELNLMPYPVNNFTPTDIQTYFTGQINNLLTTTQQGNQFQTPQSLLEVPLTLSYNSPCGNSPMINSNVIDTFNTNNYLLNNNTMTIENIESQ